MTAQRFTFVPEAGITCSQIDGDWLQGFDKRGLTLGIGSNYYISDKLYLGFVARYMQLGSEVGAKKQNKPSGAIQFTTNFDAASVGINFMFAPFNPNVRLGAGLSYNRILDFQYNALIKLSMKNENFLEIERLVTNYPSYNININFKIIDRLYFNILFHKSIKNLLSGTDSRASVETLVPFYINYTLVYEIDPKPNRSRKSSKKKKRQPQSSL